MAEFQNSESAKFSIPIVIDFNTYEPHLDSFYASTPEGDITMQVIFTSASHKTTKFIRSFKKTGLRSSSSNYYRPHIICHSEQEPLIIDHIDRSYFKSVGLPFLTPKGKYFTKYAERIVYPYDMWTNITLAPSYPEIKELALSKVEALKPFDGLLVFDLFAGPVMHDIESVFFGKISLANDGLLNIDFYSNSFALTGKSFPDKLNPWIHHILRPELSEAQITKIRAGVHLKVWVQCPNGQIRSVPFKEIIPDFLTASTPKPSSSSPSYKENNEDNYDSKKQKRVRPIEDLPDERIISYNESTGIAEIATSIQPVMEIGEISAPVAPPSSTPLNDFPAKLIPKKPLRCDDRIISFEPEDPTEGYFE